MTQIGWRFPPLSDGTRQGYTNNDIEGFKGQNLIDNLVREICQNSLDAHLEEAEAPVKVVFELKQIKRNQYDVFSQYRDCLAGCRKYWGNGMDVKLSRFVSGAEKTLERLEIPVLVVSDYNTKGLDGSRSRDFSSSWEALTGSDGVSVKSNPNSAGSYGIGKNAPFACSSLSMVFYNTLDERNENAFIGVARLATLFNSEGEETQRIGKYQKKDEEDKKWKPIFSYDQNDFRDCFTRTKRGTDIIIVGFTQCDNWVKNITKAVLKNFFVAICEKRLVVELKDDNRTCVIDSVTISQKFSELENAPEMVATLQLYKAFTSPDRQESYKVLEGDDLESADIEVYIKSDSSYKRTIANFRATGMLVGTYYKRIFPHYAAVVVVRGQKLGELLKDTEPPKHDKWDYKQIEYADHNRRKQAQMSIMKIETFVTDLLKSQFEPVAEDIVDAAGVGEYIPDETDGLAGQADGDDILKVKIKIGRIKTNHTLRGTITSEVTQDEGTEKEGDVHNRTRNPNPTPPKPRIPKTVISDSDDPDPQLGVTQGNGMKIINTPIFTTQRAFLVDCSQGLYRIVIKPAKTYKNLYVKCSAVGENGQSDALDMESFTYKGKSVKIVGGKAGPMNVKANTLAIFFVMFVKKEKMELSLLWTEENKK